jgi:hypothetical protein
MTTFEKGQTVKHIASGSEYHIVDIAADGGLTFEGFREMRPFDPQYYESPPSWEDIEVGDTFTFRLALTGSEFTTTEPFAGWHTVETPWGPGPGVTLVSIEKPVFPSKPGSTVKGSAYGIDGITLFRTKYLDQDQRTIIALYPDGTWGWEYDGILDDFTPDKD